MKTKIFLAAIVFTGVTSFGKTAHRNAYSTPVPTQASVGSITATTSLNVGTPKAQVPKTVKTEKLSNETAQPTQVSAGEGQAKQVVRPQALQYTKNDKIDNGARAKCSKNANGTWSVTRKGKTFTGPTEDPEDTFRRASHLKQNVNFGQANGLKSPAEGNYIVVNTGGVDYRSFVQPASDDYYYWTTETDRKLALSGGSPNIQKMGIELLGDGECQLSWGGGGGAKGKGGGGGDVPTTNNGGVGGGSQKQSQGKT